MPAKQRCVPAIRTVRLRITPEANAGEVAALAIALDLHRLELILGDGDSDRVLCGVELALDLESLCRRGVGDQVDDDFVGGERPTSRVHGDVGEESVLDLYLYVAAVNT